jgi:hypothetical protein
MMMTNMRRGHNINSVNTEGTTVSEQNAALSLPHAASMHAMQQGKQSESEVRVSVTKTTGTVK